MSTKTETITIEVSSRIIRHISRGIYRSPAGALKELVSNAYDAGAKKVTINTGYPVVEKVIVSDNGTGITKQSFIKIIKQIGYSDKTIGDKVKVIDSKAVRKAVGHYGIGFLAIGQLAKEAVITSKLKGSTKGFQASIDFDQFEKHKVDGIVRSKTRDEMLLEKGDKNKKTFPIGLCQIVDVEFDGSVKDTHFTKIELLAIREDVQRKIEGKGIGKFSEQALNQKKYTATFSDVLNLLLEKEKSGQKSNGKNVPKLNEYFYEMLLWELAVYSPLEYPDISIFSKGELKHFNDLVTKVDFELVVDGYILKKPFHTSFWANEEKFPKTIFRWENEKYHGDYNVSAYLIFQSGTMIRPKVMQGVLVRENNVAVGLYDKSYLSYPFFEGTKFDHLTGEIYAEGLAGAMNVDRDSFNITDDAYVKLADWFHDKLYNEVFTKIDKILNERRKDKEKDDGEDGISKILKPIISSSASVKKIVFKNLGRGDKKRFVVENKILTINTNHKDCKINASNKEKLLLAISLIAKKQITVEIFEAVSDEISDSKLSIKK